MSDRYAYITTDTGPMAHRLRVADADEQARARALAAAVHGAGSAVAVARLAQSARPTLPREILWSVVATECRHWSRGLVGGVLRRRTSAHHLRVALPGMSAAVRSDIQSHAFDLLIRDGMAGAFWMLRTMLSGEHVAATGWESGAISVATHAELDRLHAVIVSGAPTYVRVAERRTEHGLRCNWAMTPACRSASLMLLLPNAPTAMLRAAARRLQGERPWELSGLVYHAHADESVWDIVVRAARAAGNDDGTDDSEVTDDRWGSAQRIRGAFLYATQTHRCPTVRPLLERCGFEGWHAILLSAGTTQECESAVRGMMEADPARALAYLADSPPDVFAHVRPEMLVGTLGHGEPWVRETALFALSALGCPSTGVPHFPMAWVDDEVDIPF